MVESPEFGQVGGCGVQQSAWKRKELRVPGGDQVETSELGA